MNRSCQRAAPFQISSLLVTRYHHAIRDLPRIILISTTVDYRRAAVTGVSTSACSSRCQAHVLYVRTCRIIGSASSYSRLARVQPKSVPLPVSSSGDFCPTTLLRMATSVYSWALLWGSDTFRVRCILGKGGRTTGFCGMKRV